MPNDPRSSGASGAPYLGLLAAGLCFVVILLDAYDTGVGSYTAPMLAQAGLCRRGRSPRPSVATSFGAVIGYVSCRALAARIGYGWLVIGRVALFGLMSLVTLSAAGIMSLTVPRRRSTRRSIRRRRAQPESAGRRR